MNNNNENIYFASHSQMAHYHKKYIDSGDMITGESTFFKYTNGCAKEYQCALSMYIITELSSKYGIILDHSIGDTSHVKDIVDGLNDIGKI